MDLQTHRRKETKEASSPSYPVIPTILVRAINKFMAGDAKGGTGGTQREVCHTKGVKGGFIGKERFPRQREANLAILYLISAISAQFTNSRLINPDKMVQQKRGR